MKRPSNVPESVVVYDGTSVFVESSDYRLQRDEKIVFRGTFEQCCEYQEEEQPKIW